jgi:acyl carrier protein
VQMTSATIVAQPGVLLRNWRDQSAVLSQMFMLTLRRHLHHLAPSDGLSPQRSLRELGLDSMKAVTLMLDLESQFGVTLPESSLRPETFANAATLWTEVDKSMRP